MPVLLALIALTLLTVRRRKIPARIKYRGKIRRSWWKKPGNRNRIGHGARGVPYAIANSLAGLWFMAKVLRKKAADRDLRITSDGVIVVVHWTKAYEGWLGKGVTEGVEHSTWGVVRTWTAMGKYRIHTVWEDIDYIANRKLGITMYIEPKTNQFTLAHHKAMKAHADERGVPMRGYSYYRDQVRLMNQAGIHATQLRPAK